MYGEKDHYIAAKSEEDFKRIQKTYNSFQERILLEGTGKHLLIMESANDKNGIIIFPHFEDEEITNVKKKGELESLIIPIEKENKMVQIEGNNFYIMKKGRFRGPKPPKNL